MLAIERCGYYNRKPKVYKSSSQYPCIKSCSHHDGKKVKPGYGKIGCYRSYMDFIYKGQSYSVTPQLLGILNGFPVDFDWGENKAQAAAAIGNAVVPRMAELIARDLDQSAE
jgi:site-specific DNA-cytosine methylase